MSTGVLVPLELEGDGDVTGMAPDGGTNGLEALGSQTTEGRLGQGEEDQGKLGQGQDGFTLSVHSMKMGSHQSTA